MIQVMLRTADDAEARPNLVWPAGGDTRARIRKRWKTTLAISGAYLFCTGHTDPESPNPWAMLLPQTHQPGASGAASRFIASGMMDIAGRDPSAATAAATKAGAQTSERAALAYDWSDLTERSHAQQAWIDDPPRVPSSTASQHVRFHVREVREEPPPLPYDWT